MALVYNDHCPICEATTSWIKGDRDARCRQCGNSVWDWAQAKKDKKLRARAAATSALADEIDFTEVDGKAIK